MFGDRAALPSTASFRVRQNLFCNPSHGAHGFLPSASVAELNVRSKQTFRAVASRAAALSHKADLV
jgi:hypothetical protein